MEIKGIGTDIVRVARFHELGTDAPFLRRVFTDAELEYCRSFPEPEPHYASTFAGKEAVVKAIPDESERNLREIEILRDEHGAPRVRLSWDSALSVLVSLSHSTEYAVAVALAVPVSSVSNTDELHKLLNGASSEILPE